MHQPLDLSTTNTCHIALTLHEPEHLQVDRRHDPLDVSLVDAVGLGVVLPFCWSIDGHGLPAHLTQSLVHTHRNYEHVHAGTHRYVDCCVCDLGVAGPRLPISTHGNDADVFPDCAPRPRFARVVRHFFNVEPKRKGHRKPSCSVNPLAGAENARTLK